MMVKNNSPIQHTCHECGEQFSGKFCPHCGAEAGGAVHFCPRCGTERNETAPYCNNCGYFFAEKQTATPSSATIPVKKVALLISIPSLVCLLLAIVLIFQLIPLRPSGKPQNPDDNITADTGKNPGTTTPDNDEENPSIKDETPDGEETPTKADYTITVKDQDGNAISGIFVSICTTATGTCSMPVSTNMEGVATHKNKTIQGYAAQVVIPEGYSHADQTTDASGSTIVKIHFAEGATTLTVVLNKEPTNWYDTLDFDKNLTIMISNAVDNELSSGGDSYMKGPDLKLDETGGSFEKVQNAVYDRNRAAKKALGVELSYIYCDKSWGSVAGDIRTREQSGNGTADMYCDLMHDLVALSVEQGMFSNLLKYTEKNDAQIEGYVGGYLDIRAKNGYYVDYMNDMALSDDKMFLVASDYYLDVLRAMLVMPFNLQMYIDRIDSTDTNGEKLYAMVEDGDWTWDKFMTMSSVYTGTGNATINDDNLLMALSCGGLSAIGLIYSTAFTTFDITYVEDKAVYNLSQEARSVIDQIFRKAAQVVSTNGVVCDESTYGDVNGVIAAKETFTNGQALFAGPNMLGVIEEDAFQNMDRLSILPVPKLSTEYEYNTAINTRARVGAVGFSSTNKKEISALIQYMTEESEEVKDEYFNKAMTGKYLVGSGAGKVLTMIYNNIGDNKSMIIDNLILARNDSVGRSYTWAELIKDSFFEGNANNVSTLWSEAISAKQSVLNSAVEDWYECD